MAFEIFLRKKVMIEKENLEIDEFGNVKVSWQEYSTFVNWRNYKLAELVKPLQEWLKLYMPYKTIEITKDTFKTK